MKINIYRQEEGRKYMISFDDVTSNGQGFGGSVTLDVEDFKTLGEKINAELEDLQKSDSKTEVVWNPRSQRHETIKK
ncbi:MAG: hypothetical protein VZR31_08790 [Lachnospiraceae bacterium]|nr:hypothetical protein [Lachnospiraceae bacterium]